MWIRRRKQPLINLFFCRCISEVNKNKVINGVPLIQFTKSERIGVWMFLFLGQFWPGSILTLDDLAQKLGLGDRHNTQVKIGKDFLLQKLFSRVECFDKVRSEQCCQSVRLRWQSSVKTPLVATIRNARLGLGLKFIPTWFRSDGLTGVFHSSLLGVYTMDDYNNGANITHNSRYLINQYVLMLQISKEYLFRRVYRQIDGDSFLYYWDWGPNSGWYSSIHFHSR